MGKIAFVFSGQGDQKSGMGKDLYEEYGEARRIMRLCEQVRPGTIRQCFYGSQEELKDTSNAQPCLFAVELAAAKVLTAHRIIPDVVAGFSLGEVTACVFAGIFSHKQGFELVIRRGELMKEAAERHPSFMAAVLRLDGERVKEISHQVKDVYAVNFNCPGQTTVSGREESRALFDEKVREAGGRTIYLQVSGGFHSPFMEAASHNFRRTIDQLSVKKPGISVYSNATALPYPENTGEIRQLLARQITSPVLWEDTIKNMVCEGVDTFIEVGPGSTLSGMIRKIDRTIKTYTISDLPKIRQEVRTC